MKAKLTKLLNLTTSTFDGEALNAIRAANSMLDKNGTTWEEVMKGGDTWTLEFEINCLKAEIKRLKNVPAKCDVTVKVKLDMCLRYNPQNTFLNSLSRGYKKYGSLTPKQMTVLNKIYYDLCSTQEENI